MKNIFFLVGERSADLHTSYVIKKLQNRIPSLMLWGIGGTNMQNYGFTSIYPFTRFNVIGFVEVIKHLLFFINVKRRIKLLFKKRKPDLVVLVDYPGLNFQIAKMAHKMGIKVLYYITPQFWAWKEKRKFKLKKYCNKLAVIFPFEERLLANINANVEFVGHPLNEELTFSFSREKFCQKYNLSKNKKWLGFIPGSRNSEIKKILPPLIDTIKKLNKRGNTQYEILVSYADSVSKSLFDKLISPVRDKITLVSETHSLMKYSDLLICKSGTASLEAAYIGTPLMVIYKTSYISYLIAKFLVKIKMIAMPNIILGKKIIPEIIQNDLNPNTIIENIEYSLENKKNYQQLTNDLKLVAKKLKGKKPSKKVAQIIIDQINEAKK